MATSKGPSTFSSCGPSPSSSSSAKGRADDLAALFVKIFAPPNLRTVSSPHGQQESPVVLEFLKKAPIYLTTYPDIILQENFPVWLSQRVLYFWALENATADAADDVLFTLLHLLQTRAPHLIPIVYDLLLGAVQGKVKGGGHFTHVLLVAECTDVAEDQSSEPAPRHLACMANEALKIIFSSAEEAEMLRLRVLAFMLEMVKVAVDLIRGNENLTRLWNECSRIVATSDNEKTLALALRLALCLSAKGLPSCGKVQTDSPVMDPLNG